MSRSDASFWGADPADDDCEAETLRVSTMAEPITAWICPDHGLVQHGQVDGDNRLCLMQASDLDFGTCLQTLRGPVELALAAERDRLRLALERISKMGAVCEEFLTCGHRSCRDSCAAALTALNALSKSSLLEQGGRDATAD